MHKNITLQQKGNKAGASIHAQVDIFHLQNSSQKTQHWQNNGCQEKPTPNNCGCLKHQKHHQKKDARSPCIQHITGVILKMQLIANFVSSHHQEESNKVDGHEKVEWKKGSEQQKKISPSATTLCTFLNPQEAVNTHSPSFHKVA